MLIFFLLIILYIFEFDKKEESMEKRSSLKARLVCPYIASPFPSYQKSADSNTVLYYKRRSCVNQRMINMVRNKSIERQKE